MKKAKFWFFQIAMVAIVSLIFGSPVFAGPPDHSKGKGAETSSNSHSNHSGGNAQAEYHANDNAAFMGVGDSGDTGDTGDEGDGGDGGDEGDGGDNCVPDFSNPCP